MDENSNDLGMNENQLTAFTLGGAIFLKQKRTEY